MMNLLRNKEVRRQLWVLLALGVAGAGGCYLLHPAAGGVAALLAAATTAVSLCFTQRRYRQIAALSDQLATIAAGDHSINLRTYTEGELSILRDELHKMTRTLFHQAESLARDKIWLAEALSDISHQLKTPLTSVSVMAELLEAPGLPEEKRREFLAGIESGCERIRWLTTALLKMSRLDAQAVVFRQERYSLQQLICRAAEPLQMVMQRKQQSFAVRLPEEIWLTGDPQWMAEALGNLLKNCVEHTQTGGAICVTAEQNPLHTAVEIQDNGPGILPEDLPHIFERFYRGQNAAPDSVGIGLALARSILLRQGGEIRAESVPEQGTSFYIKLYARETM